MKVWPIIIASACLTGIIGCAEQAPTAPPVGTIETTPPTPSPPNWFQRTGDASWNAVQQPVRWMTAKKPTPAETQPIYEAPEALIVPRSDGVMFVAPQDNPSDHAAAPTPATQPRHE